MLKQLEKEEYEADVLLLPDGFLTFAQGNVDHIHGGIR